MHWVFLGYIIALAFFGRAALHPSMVSLSRPDGDPASVLTGGRLVGLGSALLTAPVVLEVEHLQGRDVALLIPVVVGLLLVPLVLTRMWWL
jgi:hypothetical protein